MKENNDQGKYLSFLHKLQQVELGDFIMIINSFGIKGNNIAKEVFELPFKIKSEKARIIKQAKKDIFKLKVYQFKDYSFFNDKLPFNLFKYYKAKYKSIKLKQRGDFIECIGDKRYSPIKCVCKSFP